MSSDEEQISLENLMKTEMEMYKIKCEMLHQELISCKVTINLSGSPYITSSSLGMS